MESQRIQTKNEERKRKHEQAYAEDREMAVEKSVLCRSKEAETSDGFLVQDILASCMPISKDVR